MDISFIEAGAKDSIGVCYVGTQRMPRDRQATNADMKQPIPLRASHG